jgi:ribosomal protein L16 Arg81 hydroxylase
MSDPQDGSTTLTDDEVTTTRFGASASIADDTADDTGDPADAADTGDDAADPADTGDDAGDDSGDAADPADTGDDS